MSRYKILVMANPRSGTLSMTRMLKSVGYAVSHERLGAHGTVSCYYFLRAKGGDYPINNRWGIHNGDPVFSIDMFDYVYHLVRHPLKCIASMRNIVGPGHRRWLARNGVTSDEMPHGKLEWAMRAWYHTNLAIEEHSAFISRRLQVENILSQWPTHDLGLAPSEVIHSHKSSGAWAAKEVTWDDLTALNAKLSSNIKYMARRYNYEV